MDHIIRNKLKWHLNLVRFKQTFLSKSDVFVLSSLPMHIILLWLIVYPVILSVTEMLYSEVVFGCHLDV